LSYLKKIPTNSFDYIFIAPPQYKGIWEKTLLILDANQNWLSGDGWIIVQIHPIEYKELKLVNFLEFDKRKYGSTLFVFFQRPFEE
jgi:16S rRNA G966 N2-methylase RsmD